MGVDVPVPVAARLAHDGALLGALSRIFVETVHALYVERAAARGAPGAKTGAVTVVQRTSSDVRLKPHLHVVFLEGAYHETGARSRGRSSCSRSRSHCRL
jgi:hypothetical protein